MQFSLYSCPIRNGLSAIPWIQVIDSLIKLIFSECVYTRREIYSLLLGYISILFWLFAQFPQLLQNARNGNANSLSLLFLNVWFFGDICNVVGCLLTGQMSFQIYLACYFVFIDAALCIQTIYFKYFKTAVHIEEEVDISENTPLYRSASQLFLPPQTQRKSKYASFAAAVLPLMLASTESASNEYVLVSSVNSNFDFWYSFGRIASWICTILYLSSRLPQIIYNFHRKTCDGLAIGMFICALMGNITYATSIFLKSTEIEYLYSSLPYLLGSLGTVCFDCIIFMQYVFYPKNV